MTDWTDRLQAASFRGVRFAVLGETTGGGRRVAVHEYPYRDTPWPEDLGKSPRKQQVTGFLVENSGIYGGGDVIAQRDLLLGACEAGGPGTLVHPTLGSMQVQLLDYSITQKWDDGRYFEFNLSFVEAGARVFPTIAVATTAAVGDAADAFDLASVLSFVARLNGLLLWPSEMVKRVTATMSAWSAMALNLVDDATRIFNVGSTLEGSYGRYFGQSANRSTSPATMTDLIAAGVVARATVQTATDDLGSAAAGLTKASASTIGTAVQAVAAALLAVSADPADGVRLMSGLAEFSPTGATLPSVIGDAMATGQSAAGDVCRRAAVAALARAAQSYQLTSADEAVTLRDQVVAAIDAEIDMAGDQAEDQAYAALRTLRQAVVTDLNSRGAALPSMQTVALSANLPALVLAQRLYQDAGRSDELVGEANPRHPAFMPRTFRALSS